MFEHKIQYQHTHHDFCLTFLSMSYISLVFASIIFFEMILKINLFGIHFGLSGSVIPYVFLYPISFIMLRIYGIKPVNNTIGATIILTLFFVLTAKIMTAVSNGQGNVNEILSNSFKMYLAGLIGMPAGMYTSFLTIHGLSKLNLAFNSVMLSIATVVGEIVNTIIVFPIGLSGKFSLSVIFNEIILGALLFKIVIGIVLSFLSIMLINILLNYRNNEISVAL